MSCVKFIGTNNDFGIDIAFYPKCSCPFSLTSQSISLTLNGTTADPHAPKWSTNPPLLPTSQTFQAPLFAPEWCGCTFSFRFSAANRAPSPGKPNFQSPINVLNIFSSMVRLHLSSPRCGCTSTSRFFHCQSCPLK